VSQVNFPAKKSNRKIGSYLFYSRERNIAIKRAGWKLRKVNEKERPL
jgi:hypothetical protein